jgi:hypothetical protein
MVLYLGERRSTHHTLARVLTNLKCRRNPRGLRRPEVDHQVVTFLKIFISIYQLKIVSCHN